MGYLKQHKTWFEYLDNIKSNGDEMEQETYFQSHISFSLVIEMYIKNMPVINSDLCYGRIDKTTNLMNIITSRIPDFRDIFANELVIGYPKLPFGYQSENFRKCEYKHSEKIKFTPPPAVSGY